MHACLSDEVVDGLLRKDLSFDGVVISECLEMEALSHNIGLGGGTVMAVNAGCDIVLLCRSFTAQQDALVGLKSGIESSMIDKQRIRNSLRRVLTLKSKCTSWDRALNPPGVNLLLTLQPSHTSLSTKALQQLYLCCPRQEQTDPARERRRTGRGVAATHSLGKTSGSIGGSQGAH